MRAWNSTLKPGKGFQQRSGFMPRAPAEHAARKRESKPARPRKAPRSRGMKGAQPTAAQRTFWDALALHVGCIACRQDGVSNHVVSIHHIDGRTKPWAHWLVLPLCAGHHQDGTGAPGLLAVHPWKARFEERYGDQIEQAQHCADSLRDAGHDYTADVRAASNARHSTGEVSQ